MRSVTAQADEYDYRMHHKAPGPDSGFPFHDMTGNYEIGGVPEDWYTHPQHYTRGEVSSGEVRKVQKAYQQAHGNPEHPVDIYRALPPGQDHINTGDWVTPSLEYARGHAQSEGSGDWPVIHMTAPAKHLWQNGDSYFEMGYHGPPSQAKTAGRR